MTFVIFQSFIITQQKFFALRKKDCQKNQEKQYWKDGEGGIFGKQIDIIIFIKNLNSGIFK